MISERFIPVRIIDRRHEDGRNSAAVDSLQTAYEVQGFPTLVVYYPKTGRHPSLGGYQGMFKTASFLERPTGIPWKTYLKTNADSTR
jgi:hypothetical protein